MKKTLLFIFMLAFIFANAQFNDDIEGYAPGLMTENAIWGSWDGADGTADDISVSTDIAVSGINSVLIAEGAVIDGVLKLGDKTAGTWYLDWQCFIPSGSTAYFNIQNTEVPGTLWNYHLNYNEDSGNAGGFTFYDATGTNQGPGNILGTGTYPPNQWFTVSMVIDMDNLTHTLTIDGTQIYNGAYLGTQIGGINFYSIDAANRYYIDDVRFDVTAPASVADLENLGFTAYPNPVQNDLTLKANENITNVAIFNVLGQEVKNVQPNALETTINMSGLNAGAYFVKVNIGSTVGTIKVIK